MTNENGRTGANIALIPPEEIGVWRLGVADTRGADTNWRRELRAGPLKARLDGVDLRAVRVGSMEVLQRVYLAVRDKAWNTIPGSVTSARVEAGFDDFRVEYGTIHRHGDLSVRCRTRYVGTPDGTLHIDLDAVSDQDFEFNRIGLNLHLGLDAYAGATVSVNRDGGEAVEETQLSAEIHPQLLRDGLPTAMIEAFDGTVVRSTSGDHVRFTFRGELFEMEDHRNWFDGNYKIYAMPLSRGFPLRFDASTGLHQSITISCDAVGSVPENLPEKATVTPFRSGRRMPVGVALAAPETLDKDIVSSLAELGADHVRIDFRHDDGHRDQRVASLADISEGVEVGLHVVPDEFDWIADLGRKLRDAGITVVRTFVYAAASDAGQPSSIADVDLVAAVRDVWPHGDTLVGGSDAFFAEVNRTPPGRLDPAGVTFPLCPQTHSTDRISIAENLASISDVVAHARRLVGGTEVHVSPVTLAPRFGPFAAGPEEGPRDPRLHGTFGAAWTVGVLAELAAAEADSVTVHAIDGPAPLVDAPDGTRRPTVSPAFHVLADYLEASSVEGVVRTSEASIRGLVLRGGGVRRWLLANLTDDEHVVRIAGIENQNVWSRPLNATTAASAVRDAATFRAAWTRISSHDGEVQLALEPWSCWTIRG